MTESDGKQLLKIARESIANAFTGKSKDAFKASLTNPQLQTRGRGLFVTINKGGDLRGCIGNIVTNKTLAEAADELALAAAFEDPRFEPLTVGEFLFCALEVSVLTEPHRVKSLDDFLPGRDGLILTVAGRRALFLPQVAPEQGWGREETANHLALKAGLPRDAWKRSDAIFETFTAEVFSE